MAEAQLNENFSDGDYTANPTWTTSAAGDWIVNASQQLQSNNLVASSTFYISTPSILATTAQWEFYVQLTFATSGSNYTDVFLTASASDLTQASTTGYFVRIGNTNDEISLYRKDAAGSFMIIDGTNGVVSSSSNNVMKIKVIRDAANNFSLLRDMSGTGTSYSSEGSVLDATYTNSAYFGILIKQSTSSFFQKHFFDDIVISAYVPDVTPPSLVSATAISSTTVDVLFNETVDAATAQSVTNYSATNGLANPVSAVRDATNTSLVHLTFGAAIPNGVNCTLTVNGVQDIAGNAISNGTATFSFYTPQRYDVVIDELIADPTPQVGLPNAEWIELKNISGFPINLQGWKVGDASGISGAMPGYVLLPDSFVIVCTGSAVPALSAFGKTISVTNFPSLDNVGETLSLIANDGTVIHAVAYSVNWYQNPIKADGGWTLEMIDTKNPCAGSSNWKESSDASGGTPGRKNSIDGNNADATAPGIVRAYASDASTLVLLFDEPLDSTKAAIKTNYSVSDGIGSPANALPVGPLFDRLILSLGGSLQANKVYTITVSGATDCSGNAIGVKNSARVGLASATDSLDVVVNEILFNPKSSGYDYVELYNRSNKILDFKQLYLGNRNSSAQVDNLKQLSTETLLFFPGDYIVVTQSKDWVKNNYLAKNPDNFIELASMASYNDDTSNIVLYNINGKIVDEFAYSDKWHFALIANTEGVSLERIDYNGKTQTKENWHSAATSAGYGTPTYQNSQFRIDQQVQGEIKLTPEVFSPDNDGFDDFLTINYQFPERGYVANITIFDASGRPVRVLQKNALCTTSGYFRWDGLNDKLQKVPVGAYIVYTEIFNLQGKTKKFKNTTVVARRF
ncbi:MAG: lamin tail domain-containing protein [Sphingobacteriales bacterium]|nr:lamin tail domain-containing protein [Sphingobacteriales bacterium]MBI3719444.1 lamin tail domain-containing protein [Sphingobacteriales bacterium]